MFTVVKDCPVQNIFDAEREHVDCMFVMEMNDRFSDVGRILAISDDFVTHSQLTEYYATLDRSTGQIYCIAGSYTIVGGCFTPPPTLALLTRSSSL